MELRDALAACRSAADLYRVQIPAENVMTPDEVVALAARADTLPEPGRAWIRRLQFQLRRVHGEPEPYRRRRIAEHVDLYEGVGPAEAPRDLVLAMTGIGMRLMLPVSLVLQALPAEGRDVLLLSDPGMAGFLRGVPGYAEDPSALVARLADDLPLSRYRTVRAFGTSMGGAAALCYGAMLGAEVAVSLAGSHPPALSLHLAEGEIDRRAFDRLHAGLAQSGTRLVCAFGAGNARDALRARMLRLARPGATLLAVRGIEQHGVLQELFMKDALRRFMAEVLLPATPWTGTVWDVSPAAGPRCPG